LSTAVGRIYRVNQIEVDVSGNCVRREGVDHVLRYQTFHVLLYLLEQGGKLVSKEELTAAIWSDAAVTDNALTQCIAEIRKAFGDDSRHPSYIKTISKVGYQFVAPVETIEASQTSDASKPEITPDESFPVTVTKVEDSALKPVGVPVTGQTGSLLDRQKVRLILLGLLILISLLVWKITKGYRAVDTASPVTSATAGQQLAVMYFENESQNRDFDWLSQGLADMMITDMSRSGALRVLSRQQLASLLEATDKSFGGSRADPMHIAETVHATNFLTGSFTALAGHFRIDIQLHDSRTGQILFADHSVFQDSSDILSQVDVLAAHLETTMALNPVVKPDLAAETTKNVEAYQYYSLGVEKAQEFENAQALNLLKQATELDPNFAMAYARIGYTYAMVDFAPEKGQPYLQKALQLSARLSEKDRLYVNSWYAISKGDVKEAEQTLTRITELYPQETEAYWRLARLSRADEHPAEGIEILKRGLAYSPNDKNLNNTLGFILLCLHRYSEAIAAEKKYVTLAPDEPNPYDSLGMAYQQSGDYPNAILQFNKALSLNPQFEPAIIHMGDVYYQTGQFDKAIELYQHYIQVTRTEDAQALGYEDLATVYLAMKKMPEAEQAATLGLKSNPNAVWPSLVIALKKSDYKTESHLEQILFKNIPTQERGTPGDQRTKFYYLGYIDLHKGNAQQALADFKTALEHLPPSSGMDIYEDCLANAELQLGRYEEAAIEYNRILKLNPNYPQTRAHLAEAETHIARVDEKQHGVKNRTSGNGRDSKLLSSSMPSFQSTASHSGSGASLQD
jgi:DNA-binding winged helix-turn-helix (wHTH) protein/tetratricopeptide (TPR) repeat protein